MTPVNQPVNIPNAAATVMPAPNAVQVVATAPASLYVGELSTEVTESMLFELFSQIGTVASIRVCRDAITRRSLGYAYVNFHNMADAERALETFNYSIIKGKQCRIMWSQRDPSVRRSGNGNIFIKNLDKSIDTKALHDTFSAFGNILSCKVVADETGSKGFGFVHFESQDSAEQAINKVNGMLLNDKKVFVGFHIPRKERQSKAEEMKMRFTNIYVKNLDESVTDEKLMEMFTPFGTVTSAVVSKDESGVSKCFGFINFEGHEAAEKACEALNETEMNGKKLYVGRAQKKSERESDLRKLHDQFKQERLNKYQGINLYVKNLDDIVDDDKLLQEFSVYGAITSAKVMKDDKNGASKGFGFVCFTTSDEAAKAVTEMNGRMIGSKPIYVALAQRKEVRKQQLETQYAQKTQMRLQQQAAMVPYPGAPPQMFYAPPQRPMMYPMQQMMPRPRWAPPAARPQQMQVMTNARPQRPARPSQQVRSPSRGSSAQQTKPNNAGNQPPNRPFKYTSNVRNTRPANEQSGTAGLTLAALANASPEIQKRMLGDRLFPLVHVHEPEFAGKVTGMLLEMDNTELLHLLESPQDLVSKVQEAVQVLKVHLQKTI